MDTINSIIFVKLTHAAVALDCVHVSSEGGGILTVFMILSDNEFQVQSIYQSLIVLEYKILTSRLFQQTFQVFALVLLPTCLSYILRTYLTCISLVNIASPFTSQQSLNLGHSPAFFSLV